MKKSLFLIAFLLTSFALNAEILPFFDGVPFELAAHTADKPNEEDPTINASAATLEAGPSAVVAGCVNAITGTYFDSSVDLVLPGAQPLIVQHTFCNFLQCHYSHKPSLEVGFSKNKHFIQALYTDDNGSGIPYKSFLRHDEPVKGSLKLTSEARKHLTNFSSNELSGRTRWANSHIDFLRARETKQYCLVLGSGIKRIFECFDQIEKGHHPGAPTGKFHLVEERCPNRNKYLYRYLGKNSLREVKAVNREGNVLAILNCTEGHLSALQHKTSFGVGDMRVDYTRNLSKPSTFSIEPSHGISTKFVYRGFFSIQKYLADRLALQVDLIPSEINHLRVTSLSAPVGTNPELVLLYRFKYDRKGIYGRTHVFDAEGGKTEYTYHHKYKYLCSKTIFDGEKELCKEKFYWFQPERPYRTKVIDGFQIKIYDEQYIPSEYLLLSQILEGEDKRYFCRHFEYDSYGNVIKNHLWGNLTGNNVHPVKLYHGVPIQNGCEVYTRTSEYSQDGLNLLVYEEDARKWVRQSYYSKSNLLKSRITGSGKSILKREFFKYDSNSILVEEIWDDGQSEDVENLEGVTERHIKMTTPQTKFPIGLPEVEQEFYYDLETHSLKLIKQLVNGYSPEGKLLSQSHYGSDGQLSFTLTWKYDLLGHVIEETNALGETISREFDAMGNKIKEQLPGLTYLYDYDHANRLIQEKEIWPDGQIFVTSHCYNLFSQKISTIDPYNQETFFFYDRQGHLIKTIQPATENRECPVLETCYNAMGQAIGTRDANGHWTKKEYTIRGQISRIEYPDGSIETKEYSLDGLLIRETAKNGLVSQYQYDPLGRVIQTEKYSAEGQLLKITSASYNAFHLLSETDEWGLVTHYRYDGAGRCIRRSKADKVVTYAYDTLGRKISETEAEITHTKVFDLLDRVIEERIESMGKICVKKQFQYDWQGNRTHEMAYTSEGIATSVTKFNPHREPLSQTNALGQTSHFTYDCIQINSKKVKRIIYTDPLGNQEVRIYDALGNISQVKRLNPLGKVIQADQHSYDLKSQKIQTTTQVFNKDVYSRVLVTAWRYDSMDRMVHCIEAQGSPSQKETRLVYNLYGEKVQTIKPDGKILYHCYDALGRLSRFHSSDCTLDYAYEYDMRDNLIQVEDRINKTINIRSYDLHDRLEKETLDTGVTLRFAYDRSDRPLTVILPDETLVRYAYDGYFLSRIDRIKENEVLYSHAYTTFDQAENLLEMQLPGKCGKITYQYDLLQRQIRTHAPHWQESSSFDCVGNLIRRDLRDAEGQVQYLYTYDDLYQLNEEKGHISHTYNHDSVYNRTSKNDESYTVNDLNQLLSQSGNTYAYDANGNLASINGIHFVYDALDRLVEVRNGQQVTHYTYDSFHRRLTKNHEGKTTRYIYWKEDEIGAIEEKKIKELRILGLGKGAEIGAAVAIELEDIPFVPLHDPYGNVVTLLDLEGNIASTYRYTAFGEEQAKDTKNPWRYSSKRVDPETGFIHFGRRYYLPSIGRWLTPDPLWFADGPNLYAYVHNKPLTSIDPDGQFAFFLVPIAISLALDYCIPVAVACLSEYAGGAIAASLLSGVASGYADPISSALDPDTYTMSGDLTTFMCNRAGMLIGAAIACRPTKAATASVQTVANIASREIAGTVINKAEIAIKKSVTTGLKQKTVVAAANKATYAAEQRIIKKGIPTLDELSKAGQKMDRGGLTKAGRALDKHGNRLDSVFPKATGNPASKNLQGQFHLDDILTHPNARIKKHYSNNFGTGVIDIQIPGGGGVRFSNKNEFIGFLNP